MAEKRRTREDIKRERKQQKKSKKPTVGTWIKRIIITVILLGIIGLLSGIALLTYYASDAPALDEALLSDPVTSEFYDRNGEIFATMGVENRKYVEYKDIPQEMIDAILATEDVRFYEHFGLDVWRLGGAVFANVRDGFGAQGASTLTQQVVKNSFLKNEKKLKRKAQEAWLAIQLERTYSKEEIFEMYFNKILMSGNTYGFGTAAQEFYGKELQELSLSEMALLAGMPQSPNNYNPFNSPESAEKRRNIVLSLMVQHEKITQAQADAAKAESISANLLSEEERLDKATTKYPAFLENVLRELRENGDEEALADGLQVYTTLDPKAQATVEQVMTNPNNFPTEEIESGIAVVDTATGELRAIGGGRHYDARLGYNFANKTDRGPGSTMKPLVSYGPAIEYLKWSTGQTLVDEPMTYQGSSQPINNWDGQYMGAITARTALSASRNVPAVKAFYEVGEENAMKFLNGVGIEPKAVYASDALGGSNVKLTPVQMAASYAAFGNNGVYTDPHSITKIVYRDGVTTKNYKPEAAPAMSDYTAYMVTDMLRGVISGPDATGSNAYVPGVDIAGKTGTTNYDADEFTKYNFPDTAVPDSWFVGYTTDYSIAIWSGYKYRREAITTWPERRLPQTLFKTIMTDLVADGAPAKFKQPNSVISATIEVGSNPLKLASKYTPNNLRKTELFINGNAPSQVSEKYKAVEVSAPTGLSGNYNQAAGTINLSWSHKAPNAATKITFEVAVSIDGGASRVIGTTASQAYSIRNAKPGSSYTFSVVALSPEKRSGAATTKVQVAKAPEPPKVEEKEKVEEVEEVKEPEVPEKPEPEKTEPTEPSTPATETPDANSGTEDESGTDQKQEGTATPPATTAPPVTTTPPTTTPPATTPPAETPPAEDAEDVEE